MGFVRSGIIVGCLIITYTYISSKFENKLPVNVDGYCHPAFKHVADVFRKNVESGKEPGGAFAVYHKGQLVIDMWGGYADVEAQRPWSRDTIALAYSATKGVAAIVVATMVEKGYLNYSRPVADYWPEFAQNEKGNITVEMLMSHQAGLPVLDETIHIRDIKENHQKVEEVLARPKTLWPAGTQTGYHPVTFGAYVDTLLRKADPRGRDIAEIFKEDIAGVFDLDMFMNTPKEQFHRAARMHQDSKLMVLLKAYMVPKYAKLFTNLILFPDSMLARSVRAVDEFSDIVYNLNNPDIREIPLSSVMGTGTARAFAKLYGVLGNGGEDEKHRLLSQEMITKLGTPLWSGIDVVVGLPVNTGLGTQFAQNPKGQPVLDNRVMVVS